MSDLLDMAYINSLPQPFLGKTLRNIEWPIYDIDVETGLIRIDVCGRLEVKEIGDFTSFRDALGNVHQMEGFFTDATPEERSAPSVPNGEVRK